MNIKCLRLKIQILVKSIYFFFISQIKHKNGKDVVAKVSSSQVQNKKVMYSIRCKYLDTKMAATLLKSE